MTSVLQGVVGEGVRIQVSPEDGLPPVRVDLGQIQRAILDLATHARDAMPDGGTLIVETSRIVLTEAYVAQHITVQPGVYVMLAISDTGSGIDADMQCTSSSHSTRRAKVAGAGFGLSAVHGIVRQSGGHIWVYSEPGHGTTFKIYLPEASSRDRAMASRGACSHCHADERRCCSSKMSRGCATSRDRSWEVRLHGGDREQRRGRAGALPRSPARTGSADHRRRDARDQR